LDYWRVIRARKEIVIAVFLLVVLTGIVITSLLPKVYEASCVIQVKEEQPDVPIFERERWQYDPTFLRTQFEIIQSGPVIEDVVRRQGLHTRLSQALGLDVLPPDKAFRLVTKIVSRSLRVQHYRDTNLIEIRIAYSEPKGEAHVEATATANLIADVYREQSLARSHRVTQNALEAVKRKLDEQEAKLEEAQKNVERIRQKYRIAAFSKSTGSESVTERRRLARLLDELVHVRMQLEDKKAVHEKVASLSEDDLEDAAPYLAPDPALAGLIRAKQEAEVRYSDLVMAGYGPKHPEVDRSKAVILQLKAKVRDKLAGLRTGIRHQYEAAKAQYVALEEMLQGTEASEIELEAGAYQEFDKALEELEHTKRFRDVLEGRYIQTGIQLDIPTTIVHIIEPAEEPSIEEYVSPKFALNIILSILLALGTGFGLAFFIEYVDTSVKTIDDVERSMELPVVGVIPQKVEAFTDPRSYKDHAEAYRMLRTNVRLSDRVKDGKAFCITSGSMAEGKSLTVFNLAYVCANLGDRVLVVDADLHRPRQHKIMDAERTPGLANVLAGDISMEDAIRDTEIPNLHLLSSGKAASGSHGLLDTTQMRELVKEAREMYDLVLFDAPPLIGVSDASLLVREMDGVILVVQHRKYPRTVSMRAKSMAESVGATIVGVVLNRINIAKDYSYYYHYSYHYYYPRREEDAGEEQSA